MKIDINIEVGRDGTATTYTPVANGTGVLTRIEFRIPIDFDPSPGGFWLHEGYQSWDHAGFHSLPLPSARDAESALDRGGIDPHRTFWRALFGRDGERVIGIAALTAHRLVTAFTLAVGAVGAVGAGVEVEVDQAGGPLGRRQGFSFRQGRPDDVALEVPGSGLRGETVVVIEGSDVHAVAEELADRSATAMGARSWHGPPLRGWESWYHYGLDVTAADQLANTALMRHRLAHLGFVQSQIDDGWQPAYGDWIPHPHKDFADIGMNELADRLAASGCVPGLWIAPFMVSDHARLAVDHPDWIIMDRASSGAPARHPSELDRLALDASHPAVIAFVEDLGATIRSWGYRFVKADFLFLGALEGHRYDPRITGTEAMREGLEALRRGLGDDVFLLGCGMPMLPGVGIVDANRIGGDIGGTQSQTDFHLYRCAARNAAARAALHRRWWINDPDVLMLGPFTPPECRTVMAIGALSGGPYFLSDPLPDLDEQRWAIASDPVLADLAGGPGFRALDLVTAPESPGDDRFICRSALAAPRIWVGERTVALFNWADTDWTASVPALGIDGLVVGARDVAVVDLTGRGRASTDPE